MPFLMVDLDDTGDCQRGMRQLRRHLRHADAEQPGPCREPVVRARGGGNAGKMPVETKATANPTTRRLAISGPNRPTRRYPTVASGT